MRARLTLGSVNPCQLTPAAADSLGASSRKPPARNEQSGSRRRAAKEHGLSVTVKPTDKPVLLPNLEPDAFLDLRPSGADRFCVRFGLNVMSPGDPGLSAETVKPVTSHSQPPARLVGRRALLSVGRRVPPQECARSKASPSYSRIGKARSRRPHPPWARPRKTGCEPQASV